MLWHWRKVRISDSTGWFIWIFSFSDSFEFSIQNKNFITCLNLVIYCPIQLKSISLWLQKRVLHQLHSINIIIFWHWRRVRISDSTGWFIWIFSFSDSFEFSIPNKNFISCLYLVIYCPIQLKSISLWLQKRVPHKCWALRNGFFVLFHYIQ